jgi:hypothetical protein
LGGRDDTRLLQRDRLSSDAEPPSKPRSNTWRTSLPFGWDDDELTISKVPLKDRGINVTG